MKCGGTRAGATLLELVIAITLLVIVLGVPGMLLSTSSRAYSTGAASGEIDLLARRTIDAVRRRLDASGVVAIPQAAGGPGIGWSMVDFQRVSGFAGGIPTWGAPERFVLMPESGDPDDGVDNNNNGVVDEKRVIWFENFGLPGQQSRVLCSGVRDALEGEVSANGVDDNANGLIDEEGLVFTFDGERVTIQLTLEVRDSFGVVLRHTVGRVIALRN